MDAIFVNTHGEQQNKQTTQTCYKLITNISLKKPKETKCSSKLVHLFCVEKYKTTLKNNKLKVIISGCTEEFQFPDGSYLKSGIKIISSIS